MQNEKSGGGAKEKVEYQKRGVKENNRIKSKVKYKKGLSKGG